MSFKYPSLRNKSNPIVSPIDCKHHLEACVISFIAENSLPPSSSKINWIVRNILGTAKHVGIKNESNSSQLQINR